MKAFIQKSIRTIVGLVILGAGAGTATIMWQTRPQAKEKEEKIPIPIVETVPVKFESVDIVVPSQGMIEPARRTSLASEVGGKVISVSDKFDVGGKFQKDEVIIEIDDSDYRAALARAESQLAQAELNFATETARAAQAAKDWEKLGNGGTPSDLTLKKPQLAAAKAAIESAKADIEKAKRDLKRTKITAPFAGTVEAKRTEIGNYLAPGAPVADIFQSEPFEIRLPVSLNDIRFVKAGPNGEPTGAVKIKSGDIVWDANIVRSEGTVDRMSRSMHLVAEVGADANTGSIPIQPGLFVQAGISGKTISNVAKVPFPAFLDLERVVVVDPDNKLRFREVEILRREDENVLVTGGLQNGERLCLTELPDMIEGMVVKPRELGAEPVLTEKGDAEAPVKP